jgi:hypothetical protein
MPIASIKTYLDQVEQVLADESLDEPQLVQLRTAVKERVAVSGDPVSTRLVAVFSDADEKLPPGQVQALEAHVLERLPDA